MFNHKDILSNNIRILSNKDVSIINNDDEDYIYGPLTVEGGGVFKKGLAIGSQEKMIPGLIIYDTENFYGFSEKHGLSLFSTHPEYVELNIPNNIFEIKNERNTIHPTEKNSENFQNLIETEKIDEKTLNIDLEIKDVNNFYINIPETYNYTKTIIKFNINYIYDLNSIISNLSLSIINNSNKSILYKITNDCYYDDSMEDVGEFKKDSISKIFLEIINDKYFMLSKKNFKKC
jgi:hypothetical protein